MDFGAKGPPRPEINLTQLIDVVLLLLIFFMISTSFVAQPGISIKLPQARTSDTHRGDATRITLTATGLLFVGDRKVKWEALASALKDARENNEHGFLVIIPADPDHGVDDFFRICTHSNAPKMIDEKFLRMGLYPSNNKQSDKETKYLSTLSAKRCLRYE